MVNDKRNGLGFIEKNKGNIVKDGVWKDDNYIGNLRQLK